MQNHVRAISILSNQPDQTKTSSNSLVYGLAREKNFNVKTFLLQLSETKKKTVTTKADQSGVQVFRRFRLHFD